MGGAGALQPDLAEHVNPFKIYLLSVFESPKLHKLREFIRRMDSRSFFVFEWDEKFIPEGEIP